MNGMKYLPLTIEQVFPDFNRETWDTLKNGSRHAVLAGHSQATARMVHSEAMRIAANGTMTYESAEMVIVNYLQNNDESRVNLNIKLDQFSQKGHPGLGIYGLSTDSGTIMKARQVNKSSKGKHPANYTPPKKKRK